MITPIGDDEKIQTTQDDAITSEELGIVSSS
jgi:hypothetical protein